MRCHLVKNTLLRIAFSAILPAGLAPNAKFSVSFCVANLRLLLKTLRFLFHHFYLHLGIIKCINVLDLTRYTIRCKSLTWHISSFFYVTRYVLWRPFVNIGSAEVANLRLYIWPMFYLSDIYFIMDYLHNISASPSICRKSK